MKRVDRFRGYQPTVKRPAPLNRFVSMYRNQFRKIPDQIRVSFSDGTTAVYQLKVEMPAPVIYR